MIRAVRNTHVAVNQLPPEILSKVLEHRDYEWDLIAATHVCQYWRSTLTSSPSLWTNFRFRSSDAGRMLTYLERSKSVTIDIRIVIDPSEGPEVFHHFVPHITRTRTFVIQGFGDVHAASSLLLCGPAPFLEHLEVRAYEGPVRGIANFLGQQAPSLRSINFDGTFPMLESTFPLPNLTDFNLFLPDDSGKFRISSLLRFFSDSPRLQKISIGISSEIIQDATPDQVISLESLTELDYACRNPIGRVLPHLKLPHLSRLRSSSFLHEGQVHKLAEFLPNGCRALLEGVTSMLYSCNEYSQMVYFPGKDTDVSVTVHNGGTNSGRIDWFSDETYGPFGRIEDLEVEGHYIASDFFLEPFKSLTSFRVTSWNAEFTEGFLRLLCPPEGAAFPCPSLREIQCTSWEHPGSITRSLVSVVKERERLGQQLALVRIFSGEKPSPEVEEELREHIGELRLESLEERHKFLLFPLQR